MQGNSSAGNAEEPIPETAPSRITMVDPVHRFQPNLLIQVFRNPPVAPDEVENKAVGLVQMAIDGGAPGGAITLPEGRNQTELVVVGHARSCWGSRVVIGIFAQGGEILRRGAGL